MSPEPAPRGGQADLSPTEHGEHVPPTRQENVSFRTLVWTAATTRPVEEVAALVELLKRSGDDPNPGDEALRVAAMTRPVSEVGPLLALLGEAPHTAEASYEALRAAAVGRSVDEVAQLIKLFDRAQDGQVPSPEPSDGDPYHDSHADTASMATTSLPVHNDPYADPYGDPYSDPYGHPGSDHGYGAQGSDHGYAAQGPGGGESAMQDTPPRPQRAPWPGANAPHGGWPGHGAPTQHGPAVGGVLRSVLRWPAAAALALCGLSHLPLGAAETQGGASDALSMAVAVVYLLLAGFLAVRDTSAVWIASAAAAVTVIVLHALSRAGVLVPLRSSLGNASMWPELLAVALAIVSAGLAGAALLLRPRRVSPATAGV
ncbi:hypothetical protein ACFU90_01865 [Streptomyces noursei]|uniref:Uncharacterized protein n=1 Tax=Streptomyces noursei TaxID=1971 RepID=A0A401QVX4_STRNR|nr:hypothetical protein [Streptomyces noursei]UWS70732.1 hypothetical protein N1H47_05475 [Streptomyces noursei]GCB89473.1 hypothetical protein SALB_02148 [Streptomyces noursei]